MKTFWRKTIENHSMVGFVCLFVSICLITAGFVLPPVGVIDNSVLVATGLLLGFDVIHDLPLIIRTISDTRATIRLQHGESAIEISSDNKESGQN